MPTPGAQALRHALRHSIQEQAKEDAKLAVLSCPLQHDTKSSGQKCRWPQCRLLCQRSTPQ